MHTDRQIYKFRILNDLTSIFRIMQMLLRMPFSRISKHTKAARVNDLIHMSGDILLFLQQIANDLG